MLNGGHLRGDGHSSYHGCLQAGLWGRPSCHSLRCHSWSENYHPLPCSALPPGLVAAWLKFVGSSVIARLLGVESSLVVRTVTLKRRCRKRTSTTLIRCWTIFVMQCCHTQFWLVTRDCRSRKALFLQLKENKWLSREVISSYYTSTIGESMIRKDGSISNC